MYSLGKVAGNSAADCIWRLRLYRCLSHSLVGLFQTLSLWLVLPLSLWWLAGCLGRSAWKLYRAILGQRLVSHERAGGELLATWIFRHFTKRVPRPAASIAESVGPEVQARTHRWSAARPHVYADVAGDPLRSDVAVFEFRLGALSLV